MTAPTTALAPTAGPTLDLSPRTFEQALEFAGYLADSELVPKDFQRKPGNCLIAMQWGAELGLKPLQAVQSIAVINGRPAMWGDALLALVRGSSVCEFVIEEDDGHTATCRVKRRGEPEQRRTFSVEDAQKAGLAGKAGPWSQYPKRMRQLRARAFALRDVFPDVLRGMAVAEEAQDSPPPEKNMGMAEEVARTPAPAPAPAALATYPNEDFEANLPKWRDLIQSGRKTPAQVIAQVSSRAQLTDKQVADIKACAVLPDPKPQDDASSDDQPGMFDQE